MLMLIFLEYVDPWLSAVHMYSPESEAALAVVQHDITLKSFQNIGISTPSKRSKANVHILPYIFLMETSILGVLGLKRTSGHEKKVEKHSLNELSAPFQINSNLIHNTHMTDILFFLYMGFKGV